jgi:Mrp family chromosome partitioning ATPase
MVAAGAAVALALTGIGAIALADCDFRRPSLHHLFGLDQSPGTLSVISGKMSAEAAIYNTGVGGLSVLPTERSDILPDTEFLDENRLARILKLLENRRGVIFCAPPLLDSPETLMLAARVDRTLCLSRLQVLGRPLTLRMLKSCSVRSMQRHSASYSPETVGSHVREPGRS